jgi:hypothetical protein
MSVLKNSWGNSWRLQFSVSAASLVLTMGMFSQAGIARAGDASPAIEVHELTNEQLRRMGITESNFHQNSLWTIPGGPETQPGSGGNPPPCPKAFPTAPPLGPLGPVPTPSATSPADAGCVPTDPNGNYPTPYPTYPDPGYPDPSTTWTPDPYPTWDPNPMPTGGVVGAIGGGVVILEHIVNLGKDIWQFIKDGRAVVNADLPSASALPQGVTSASQLGGWEPKSKNYQVIIPGDRKGRIEFVFRVTFWHSGSVKGQGHYIANLTVQAADYKVNWGQEFNVRARIPAEGITNVSRDENDPIAAAQVLIEWSRAKVFSTQGNSAVIYVRGDGQIKNLSAPDDEPEDLYPIGKGAGSRRRR